MHLLMGRRLKLQEAALAALTPGAGQTLNAVRFFFFSPFFRRNVEAEFLFLSPSSMIYHL